MSQVRVVRRALAADAHVLALAAGCTDGHGQQFFHRGVALVEAVRHQPGVAVQAQGELGEVVGA